MLCGDLHADMIGLLSSISASPVYATNSSPGAAVARKEDESELGRYNLRAIVVDDTKMVLKMMEKMLRQMGFQSVQCFENGSRGLEALKQQQVDIVFSDVQMPILTGPEVKNQNIEMYIEVATSTPLVCHSRRKLLK